MSKLETYKEKPVRNHFVLLTSVSFSKSQTRQEKNICQPQPYSLLKPRIISLIRLFNHQSTRNAPFATYLLQHNITLRNSFEPLKYFTACYIEKKRVFSENELHSIPSHLTWISMTCQAQHFESASQTFFFPFSVLLK